MQLRRLQAWAILMNREWKNYTTQDKSHKNIYIQKADKNTTACVGCNRHTSNWISECKGDIVYIYSKYFIVVLLESLLNFLSSWLNYYSPLCVLWKKCGAVVRMKNDGFPRRLYVRHIYISDDSFLIAASPSYVVKYTLYNPCRRGTFSHGLPANIQLMNTAFCWY